MESLKILKLYSIWCGQTKRTGGVLLGSSVREFFTWLEENYNLKITEKDVD